MYLVMAGELGEEPIVPVRKPKLESNPSSLCFVVGG
jgi:hypothetical protein